MNTVKLIQTIEKKLYINKWIPSIYELEFTNKFMSLLPQRPLWPDPDQRVSTSGNICPIKAVGGNIVGYVFTIPGKPQL